jgi:hypothetical protein
MREKTLYITPPTLLKWLPRDKRNEVVFLDLEPDFLDEKTIRIDLNVVFRPIPIRRGTIRTRDYYVGSTGARVVFEAFLGNVKRYTPAATLELITRIATNDLGTTLSNYPPMSRLAMQRLTLGKSHLPKTWKARLLHAFQHLNACCQKPFLVMVLNGN